MFLKEELGRCELMLKVNIDYELPGFSTNPPYALIEKLESLKTTPLCMTRLVIEPFSLHNPSYTAGIEVGCRLKRGDTE